MLWAALLLMQGAAIIPLAIGTWCVGARNALAGR